MFSGELECLLRELNPRLQIRRGNREHTHNRAGIYHYEKKYNVDNEDQDNGITGFWNRICSIGVNYLPERTRWDEAGHHVTRGWRETIAMLHDKGLVKIPGGQDARRRFLDPHLHGYPMVVNKHGKEIGIANRNWVK